MLTTVNVGVIGMGATELVTGVALAHAEGRVILPCGKSPRCASIEEMGDADAIVISAGRGGTASQSRLELVRSNANTVRSIAARLADMRGVLVVVTNPVDVMTYVAASASRLPERTRDRHGDDAGHGPAASGARERTEPVKQNTL